MKNKLGDQMIKQLLSLTSVIKRYGDFVGVSQISYLPQPLASPRITDLLATDKSRYFAQPRPIIVILGLFVVEVRQAQLRLLGCLEMFETMIVTILSQLRSGCDICRENTIPKIREETINVHV